MARAKLQPARRLEIGVVKKLAGRGEYVEPHCALQRAAQQRIKHGGGERAVGENFDGMLVERGDRLDPGRRMVYLVKQHPPSVHVTDPVPPVEEECADQPADKTLDRRQL
jgi:hypothetical protein